MSGLRIACFLAVMYSVACANEPEPEPASSEEKSVTGSLTLTIKDKAAFLKDNAAKDAVVAGIASLASDTVDKVKVEVSFDGEKYTKSRRLQAGESGTILVDFTITLPATMASADQDAALAKINAFTDDKLTTAINGEMSQSLKNKYGDVKVTGFKIKKDSNPQASDASKFANICWSVVFLLFSTVFTA